MSRKTSTEIGRAAEDLACSFLSNEGLKLVARNYRCRAGEVDLIMRDGSCLVFIEVRFRRSVRYGTPAESVSSLKRQRIAAAARHFLHRRSLDASCRFDLVAISGDTGREPQWIRDAFRLN